ncbi:hypothetical protein STEG23_017846 [Scotinomys teguina]
MAIRTYFSGIFRYLRGKGYSPRSWEIVRAEMQVALSTLPAPTERSPNERRRSTEESPLPPRGRQARGLKPEHTHRVSRLRDPMKGVPTVKEDTTIKFLLSIPFLHHVLPRGDSGSGWVCHIASVS